MGQSGQWSQPEQLSEEHVAALPVEAAAAAAPPPAAAAQEATRAREEEAARL